MKQWYKFSSKDRKVRGLVPARDEEQVARLAGYPVEGLVIERWYSYGVFRFTREQIIWALQHKISFDNGEWPPCIGEFITDKYDKEQRKWVEVIKEASTYTEAPIGKRQIKCEAYFAKPAIIIAEIEERLKTTHEAGEALIDEINAGITDIDSLSRPARRALNYISGWRRRKLSYSLWKAQQKYYKYIVMAAKA